MPDAIILRGVLGDYRDRLPTASDVLCVIEVADSSYERDTGQKLIGYAKAGVQQYVVINLRARTAEVYTIPNISSGTYAQLQIVPESEGVQLRAGEEESSRVGLAELMP